MDDAPLSLYGIPLYINTLQVMLDDGAVHTALCRKKKEGTERYHLGRHSSSCILFILQQKFI